MKKSILSLLLACFLQINLAFAQNVMKGVVSDANGPLVGVVIHDKDNAKGTTSDMSGKYALNGAESGHTIEFRYLGYVTETVVWDGKSVVNIKLKEDAVQLEETVVIGYGSQQFAYRETEHVSTFTIFARTDSGTDGYPFEQYAGSECYGSGAWCDNNV